MNALFVNYPELQCGVAQFGRNLWGVLKDSTNLQWTYCEPATLGEFRTFTSMPEPDFILYNWQSGQGGFLTEAPFPWLKSKQCLCYHDNDLNENAWDAIFFADPTMTPSGRWHVMGRPLPEYPRDYQPQEWGPLSRAGYPCPIIGVHGFIGAWADQVVHRVMQEFEYATIRLSLPFSKYCDPNGAVAMAMAERCRNMAAGSPGIRLLITHDFLPAQQLVEWLAQNDLNCYLRPGDMNWRGLSSAPDFALAARRPLAINKCNAFRHLHHLSPSICVEDRSLTEIFFSGLSPLVAFKAKWCDPDEIRNQVEPVLLKL